MSDYLKRKNLLWEGSRFVLPEQKAALLKYQEEAKKVERPLLDEQELYEIGMIIMEAMKYQIKVNVTYWENGLYKERVALIERIDSVLKRIKLKWEGEVEYIDINCLKKVEK
ncbi:YolD-like family protein [Bacillus solitudinis]|uniref:YolD-like family protein n=1 Tax=Bacillus solitudinis TaxID=2014074 RepID=UPI000C23D8B3|nr:YolD-like family protein [Bacillus solitudinis]